MKAPIAKIPDYLKIFRTMGNELLDLFDKIINHGFHGINPHSLVALRKLTVIQSDRAGKFFVNPIAKRQYYIFLQEIESCRSNRY